MGKNNKKNGQQLKGSNDPNEHAHYEIGKGKFPRNDPHLSWFYRPHTLMLLTICVCVVVYIAFSRDSSAPADAVNNLLYGTYAGVGFFLLFSCLNMPDGLFKRPHPVVWRLVMGMAVVYIILMFFLLFQDVDDVRQWLKFLDPELGVPLKMKDYAADCRLFTPDDEDSYFSNFRGAVFEQFALAHLLGWWMKTLIFRDMFVVTIMSVLFEIWEYSLEHLLPNFRECWWDHWILDVLGCNLLGMLLGLLTIRFFKMQEYDFSGEESEGILKRFLTQFTPKKFDIYYINVLNSRRKFLVLFALMVFTSMVECNVFFLKYLLWFPPEHPLILGRLVLFSLMALPCLREFYHFITTPKCYKVGTMLWLFCGATTLESLVCYKYSKGSFDDIETPSHVWVGWVVGTFIVGLFSLYRLAYSAPPGVEKKKK